MEQEIGTGDRNRRSEQEIGTSKAPEASVFSGTLRGYPAQVVGRKLIVNLALFTHRAKTGQFRAAQVDHDVAIEIKSSPILLRHTRKRVAYAKSLQK